MMHDLEDVKEMFKAADELIKKQPELLSMNVDVIFDELDDGTSEMIHNRWGVMTRAKMTELKKFDNRAIIDFLLTVKERNLLSEYIGYILQSEYKVSLLQVLLDAYSIGVHNDIFPFVKSCLEYEDECFIERIEEILDIVNTIDETEKFGFVRGYAILVVKKGKEETILEKYLNYYSSALEQLILQLGRELESKRRMITKKWLDIYINEKTEYCKKMGIHFLNRSLFRDCNAFEKYFLFLEKEFCGVPDLWEMLIPVYAQYLSNEEGILYKMQVKNRLINVKKGNSREKRICVQSLIYNLEKSKESVEVLESIISVSFEKDRYILRELDDYFEHIFNIDSSDALEQLYDLYEKNRYENGDEFLDLLPQTRRAMRYGQEDILEIWWHKFVRGNNLAFLLSVEIFDKVISIDKINRLLEKISHSRNELIYLLEGIYLFTINERRIANLTFNISAYIKDREFFTQYCIDNIFINYSGALIKEAKKSIGCENVYKANLAEDILEYYNICNEKIQKGYRDRDFIPPINRNIIYYRAMIAKNKKMNEKAEARSLTASLFPLRKMKYGKRLAFIQIQRKGEYHYNVNEYTNNTVSVELPKCFINDPMKYFYMRMNYLNKRGKNETDS